MDKPNCNFLKILTHFRTKISNPPKNCPDMLFSQFFPVDCVLRGVAQKIFEYTRMLFLAKKSCTRERFRAMCPDRMPSQFTIRWFLKDGMCCAYAYGYCHVSFKNSVI